MTAVQTNCDRCGTSLAAGASYCDRCGQRTRKAQGMVRTIVRIEVVALGLMALLTAGFAYFFLIQGYNR